MNALPWFPGDSFTKTIWLRNTGILKWIIFHRGVVFFASYLSNTNELVAESYQQKLCSWFFSNIMLWSIRNNSVEGNEVVVSTISLGELRNMIARPILYFTVLRQKRYPSFLLGSNSKDAMVRFRPNLACLKQQHLSWAVAISMCIQALSLRPE